MGQRCCSRTQLAMSDKNHMYLGLGGHLPSGFILAQLGDIADVVINDDQAQWISAIKRMESNNGTTDE